LNVLNASVEMCCVDIAACGVPRRSVQRWRTSCRGWEPKMTDYTEYGHTSFFFIHVITVPNDVMKK